MIHTYEYGDKRIALDVYSGAIHILDPLSFDLLNQLNEEYKADIKLFDPEKKNELENFQKKTISILSDKYPKEDIETAFDELSDLIAQGRLFNKDDFEGLSLDVSKRKTYVKALCLNVAHSCNLNCNYCFAGQGKYHGRDALMSRSVAEKAIDFLIKESGPKKHLDIDFFGGEPALNFDLVKDTVFYALEKGRENNKNFRFTYTTNGIILNEQMIDFLNEYMDNVVLSLDGRKEINDHFRHSLDGRGSYDRIVPHFKNFVSKRADKEYYMRGTYTGLNKDFSNDVLHMASLGFYRLSMEPVIANEKAPYALKIQDLPLLEKEYDRLAGEMIRRNRLAADLLSKGKDINSLSAYDHPFIFYHFMINLNAGPCIYKRISGCGSGSEYLAVTPNGDLYPCHQFVGDDSFKVGNVFDGVVKDELISDFKSCNCYSRPDCHDCWAKLYCSGGCAANAFHAVGDLKGTVDLSCRLFRKRMECAIAIEVDKILYESSEN